MRGCGTEPFVRAHNHQIRSRACIYQTLALPAQSTQRPSERSINILLWYILPKDQAFDLGFDLGSAHGSPKCIHKFPVVHQVEEDRVINKVIVSRLGIRWSREVYSAGWRAGRGPESIARPGDTRVTIRSYYALQHFLMSSYVPVNPTKLG